MNDDESIESSSIQISLGGNNMSYGVISGSAGIPFQLHSQMLGGLTTGSFKEFVSIPVVGQESSGKTIGIPELNAGSALVDGFAGSSGSLIMALNAAYNVGSFGISNGIDAQYFMSNDNLRLSSSAASFAYGSLGNGYRLELASGLAGDGLSMTDPTKPEGGVLSVGVDGSSIEVTSDALNVKALGIATSMLAADAVTNAKLADDAVDTENIADDAITAALIDDLAVGTAALAADAVNGSKLADDAVDSEHITDSSVLSAHLASLSVTGAKVAVGTLNYNHIASGSLLAGHLAANSVDSSELVDGSIDEGHFATLAFNSLTGSANVTEVGTITSGVWSGTALVEAKIGADAIVAAKIKDDAVGASEIVALGVGTAEIQALAVNGTKLAAKVDHSGDGDYLVLDAGQEGCGLMLKGKDAAGSPVTYRLVIDGGVLSLIADATSMTEANATGAAGS